ncbi:hypothetical protein E4T52_11494 [Aureobasidium sp. EXF-3400]|nr:hypothetical protein E4T51_10509 [Aureobasidium sp. EXF-12344]KAI4773519.1 hypothetical protein E4T52_11494 [Aureobasidium sp. EXF-3400]
MRGNAPQVKVHFKGSDDDYIIFVESAQAVRDWKADKSNAIANFVGGFKVFVSHNQGTTGILDQAANSQLENEFGTDKVEDVIEQILEKGTILETENHARNGEKNVSQGPRGGH